MNIAEHANSILEAWRFNDHSSLGAALDSAVNSRTGARPASDLEGEQSEMLESIVDHLRQFASRNELPDPAQRNGAAALLAHLGSVKGAQELSDSTFSNNLALKSYNLAQKTPK